LRELARTTKRPQTRVQAIWTLAVLGGLDEASTLAALADPHPLVRRGVIKAGEGLLKTAPRLAAAVLHVTTLLVELSRGGTEPPPLAVVEPLVLLAGSSCDRPAIDCLIEAIG